MDTRSPLVVIVPEEMELTPVILVAFKKFRVLFVESVPLSGSKRKAGVSFS